MTLSGMHAIRYTICNSCQTCFERYMSPDVDVGSLRPGGSMDARRMSAENCSLASDEHLLAELESLIAFHEGLVQNMRTDRAMLCHRILTRKAFSAPIRRLPTEILQEILYLACAQDQYDWVGRPIHPVSMYGDHNRSIPSTLAQVCARWHLIVYNTPYFWAAMTMGVPSTEVERDRVRQVLARSDPFPLKLAIQSRSWRPSSALDLSFLVPALARTAELHLDYDFIAEEDLGGIIYCRLLKRLFLHVRGTYGAAERYRYSRYQLTSLMQAPALETFGTDSLTELARYDLYPRRGIAVFECGNGGTIEQTHLIELLRRCPEMRSISFAIPFTGYEHGAQEPVVVPKLQRLAYASNRPYGSPFLDIFTAPSLTELSLPVGVPDDVWENVIRFIDRSECRLRSFECTLPCSFIDDPSGWVTTFTRLVDLESFIVKVSGKTSWKGENCLGLLCQFLSGDAPLMPKLRLLHVVSRSDEWKEPDLQDMERMGMLFLSFVERRSAQNQVMEVVSLRDVRLVVESRNAWGERVGDATGGMLEARRDALISAGVKCKILFPST